MHRRQLLTALSCLGLACLGVPARARWAGETGSATGLLYDPQYLRHRMPDRHPESPQRLAAIMARLEQRGLRARCEAISPWPGDPHRAVRTLHSAEHVRALTARHPTSEAVARAVVAGILAAVDAVCSGTLRNAFCVARPPGHHALNTGRIEGFCLYNGIAIAAQHALTQHGLERILIVDWDYHHGNATERMFYTEPSVLFFSTHDYHAYPQTGDPARRGLGRGRGYNINVHLDCGADDPALLKAFAEQLVPRAERYRPQLILISAGFDSRQGDPLGCFRVSDAGFAGLTRIVQELAEVHCDGRIVSVLEGGYNLQGTARAAEAHLATLLSHHAD